MANKKCHTTVRQQGSPYASARFFAYCRCGWKERQRLTLEAAMGDAKKHDPLYPRGSQPESMA